MNPRLRVVLTRLVDRSRLRLALVQELRYELQLARLRLENRLRPARRARVREFRRLRDARLHFGCGSKNLPGWINVDGAAGAGVDFAMDLREPLPFADDSLRYVFSEHVLEHVERRTLPRILREFRRTLMPGGVVRIIVPDLAFYCRAYTEGDTERLRIPIGGARTSAEAVNSVFLDHFHRYIYDAETLGSELCEAGFYEVRTCKYGESEHEGLAVDSPGPAREVGSLCMEGCVPDSAHPPSQPQNAEKEARQGDLEAQHQ